MSLGIEYYDVYLAALEHQKRCGRGLATWTGDEPQPWLTCVECIAQRNTGGLWDQGDLRRRYAWAVPNERALEVIAGRSPGGVVEIGAGGGYWAMELQRRGVDVIAYDPDPPGTADPEWAWHENLAWTAVLPGDHTAAAWHPTRTLLMCWPMFGADWSHKAVQLYQGDTIIYVGEGPGGCTGDDLFHALIGAPGGCWHHDDDFNELPCPQDCPNNAAALFKETYQVIIPQWRGLHDRLTVHQRIPAHDTEDT